MNTIHEIENIYLNIYIYIYIYMYIYIYIYVCIKLKKLLKVYKIG